jgi:hypothetical protein
MGEEKEAGERTRGQAIVFALSLTFIVLFIAGVVSVLGGFWKKRGEDVHVAGPEVRAYFGELRDGSAVERWTIVRVYDLRAGAIPVVMATGDGARYQVDLLRRDPNGPSGVAETDAVALFIANAGDGGSSTPEEQGLGIMALAEALKKREAEGAKPPPLVTLRERLNGSDRRFDVPLR